MENKMFDEENDFEKYERNINRFKFNFRVYLWTFIIFILLAYFDLLDDACEWLNKFAIWIQGITG